MKPSPYRRGLFTCALLERRCNKLADENTVGNLQHAALFLAAFLQQTYLLKIRHGVNEEIAQEMLRQASDVVNDAFAAVAISRRERNDPIT